MGTDILYRKKECELCGKYAFEKYLGTSAVLDGGFTRVEEFESGGFCSAVVVFHTRSEETPRIECRLCLDCAKELHSFISSKIDEMRTRGGKR